MKLKPSFLVTSMSLLQGLVGRSRVEPVGPEALVERADQEDRLAVEHDPRVFVRALGNADGTQGEVTRHAIQDLIRGPARPFLKADFDRIEKRRVGSPKLDGSCGISSVRFSPRAATPEIFRRPLGRLASAKTAPSLRHPGVGRQSHLVRRGVGNEPHVLQIALRHRLEPHRLPDPRARRVVNAFRLVVLLPAGLRSPRRTDPTPRRRSRAACRA